MMPKIMKRIEKIISGFISREVLSHNVKRKMPKRTDEIESATFMMCGMSFFEAFLSGMMFLWAQVFIFVFGLIPFLVENVRILE